MPTIRQAKVGEMMRREMAELLQKELRDPRLALVSVTGVDVSRDFSVAKVFISVMGDAEEKRDAIKALQGASGFIRGHLGRAMELRTIPVLQFRPDTGIERGLQMYDLLQQESRAVEQNAVDAARAEESTQDDEDDTDFEGAGAADFEEDEADFSDIEAEMLGEDGVSRDEGVPQVSATSSTDKESKQD